jgi:hypothetical protein
MGRDSLRSRRVKMDANLSQVSLLTRREIEARIAGALIKAFAEQFGEAPTLKVCEKVIGDIAIESGAQLSSLLGGNSLEDLARGLEFWARDDALEFEILEQDNEKLYFNVTRCRYAEMYRELGIPEMGLLLSCNRDYGMIKGFNPRATFHRTQTLMEGADYCDFRFGMRSGE